MSVEDQIRDLCKKIIASESEDEALEIAAHRLQLLTCAYLDEKRLPPIRVISVGKAA